MTKPRLKPFDRLLTPEGITLIRESGWQLDLPDPDGQVRALLDLLDGTRTVPELGAALADRWPELTPSDIAEGIATLDAAGLLADAERTSDLTPWQEQRYFSNLAFFDTYAGLGRSRYDFQRTLRQAHVVLLGVGGLGSTLLYNLAGLGVGRVTAVDGDRVEAKNLARQFLYSEAEVGQPKLARAMARAQAFNSEMEFTPVERWVTGPQDVADLLPGADLVLSAIDTPASVQDWVNAACVAAGVPFLTGGMQVTQGLYYSVDPGRSGCLACLQLEAATDEAEDLDRSALEPVNRGIGPVASLLGALVSLEALRYLTGFAPPVSAGTIWQIDFATSLAKIGRAWPRRLDCPVCGPAADVALATAAADGGAR